MVPRGNVRMTKRPAGLTEATRPVVRWPGVTVTFELGLGLLATTGGGTVMGGGPALTGGFRFLPAQPINKAAQNKRTTSLMRKVK